MTSQQLVAVLGRGVVDSTERVATADDLGLTRGDAVFDATRVVTDRTGKSVVDNLDDHLARFANSAALLDLPAPDPDAWRALIAAAVFAWRVPGEATLKLLLTRGAESAPGTPTGVLTITAADPETMARVRSGIAVATLPRGYASDAFADAPWLLGGAKTTSYGVNMAAKREAARRGADDVLFVSSDGYALEAPTAGLLVALDDQLVTTPTGPTGVLRSITIEKILAAAQANGVGVRRELVRPEIIPFATGAWLCSSIRGIQPIVKLDGRDVPHVPKITATLARQAGFTA